MKALKTSSVDTKTTRVSFCSAATDLQKIEIAGQTLIPNEDTAYVEFYVGHVFPVVNKYRTANYPPVIGNSYLTMNHKVFNLAHLMRKYDPKKNPRDRILGTIVAVEFSGQPDENGRWNLSDKQNAPGIRAVAAMHKAAEGVIDILTSWFTGQMPQGCEEWSVSLENQFYEEDCGFLIQGNARTGLETLVAATPPELLDLGFVYVPYAAAPEKLLACMNNAEDDLRDGHVSTRICRDYKGSEVILLLGGLNGKIRYRGVALTPSGAREEEARVAQMLASDPASAPVDAKEAFEPLSVFGQKIFG